MMLLALGCYVFTRWIRRSSQAGLMIAAFSLVASGLLPSGWQGARCHAQVVFDVNAMAPARAVQAYGMMSRLPGSRFVEVQLDTSALFQPGSERVVQETMVRVVSRHEEVLVADFSPRTEMQSDVFGSVQVSLDSERVRELGLQAVGGVPGLGSANGFANQTDVGHHNVHFARKPAMELLTASGTLARHRGVYFKMRQSSQMTLEGARQFRIVFEVPENWRADLLDVTIEAIGLEFPNARRTSVLTSQPFVVAVYQEHDEVAARAASNYIKQQSNLIQASRSFARTIEHRNFPTPFHKLGAKLDLYEPEIPKGWFEALVYQPGASTHISKLSPLPVDVRVAVMNYLDQKMWIESLSGIKESFVPLRSGTTAQSGLPNDLARR